MKGLECNVLSLEVVTREVRIRIKCKELDLTSGVFFSSCSLHNRDRVM